MAWTCTRTRSRTVEGIIAILAVAGGTALVVRLVRSVLRLLLAAADVTAASGLAEVSARRGDLTAMAERRAAENRARRARIRSTVWALGWLAALVVPTVAGVAPAVYAIASVLWLLPRQPIRKPGDRSPR
jgi:hypothetical protein